MNAASTLARLEARREIRRSGFLRPFIDGLLIAFSFWALAVGALLVASWLNLDSKVAGPAQSAGAHAAATAAIMPGGPGRFAYFLAAAVVVWTIESTTHQIKLGYGYFRVMTNIATRTALTFWLVL